MWESGWRACRRHPARKSSPRPKDARSFDVVRPDMPEMSMRRCKFLEAVVKSLPRWLRAPSAATCVLPALAACRCVQRAQVQHGCAQSRDRRLVALPFTTGDDAAALLPAINGQGQVRGPLLRTRGSLGTGGPGSRAHWLSRGAGTGGAAAPVRSALRLSHAALLRPKSLPLAAPRHKSRGFIPRASSVSVFCRCNAQRCLQQVDARDAFHRCPITIRMP